MIVCCTRILEAVLVVPLLAWSVSLGCDFVSAMEVLIELVGVDWAVHGVCSVLYGLDRRQWRSRAIFPSHGAVSFLLVNFDSHKAPISLNGCRDHLCHQNSRHDVLSHFPPRAIPPTPSPCSPTRTCALRPHRLPLRTIVPPRRIHRLGLLSHHRPIGCNPVVHDTIPPNSPPTTTTLHASTKPNSKLNDPFAAHQNATRHSINSR